MADFDARPAGAAYLGPVLLVIGAGPTGLMAAWQAAAAGHEVTVLEASDGVGGMAGSFELAGVRVDYGSHRLHPAASPATLTRLRSLLGDDLQVRPRVGRVRLADRWIGFPLRPADLARHLPPKVVGAVAVDTLTSPFRRPRADTFAEVVRAGLGPTIAELFYRPYVRKLWGVEPTELDGELARRRVSASSPAKLARRLLGGRVAAEAGGNLGRTFLYPRTGFGAISERLADAAVGAGAKIEFGARAEQFDCSQPDNVVVRLEGGRTVEADRVWSTLPIGLLAESMLPAPPVEVLAGARGLRYRGLVLVYLVLEQARYTRFDAQYFPGLAVSLSRLSEPKNYRDNPDDPREVTVLCAEVPVTVGDRRWRAEPDEIGAEVADDLARVGLPRCRPVAVEVRRLPRVYPVYTRGFAWKLSALELWLARAAGERLLTFGRQGLFVPDNSHHTLDMAATAAGALRPDGSFDQAAWSTARASFREYVVED